MEVSLYNAQTIKPCYNLVEYLACLAFNFCLKPCSMLAQLVWDYHEQMKCKLPWIQRWAPKKQKSVTSWHPIQNSYFNACGVNVLEVDKPFPFPLIFKDMYIIHLQFPLLFLFIFSNLQSCCVFNECKHDKEDVANKYATNKSSYKPWWSFNPGAHWSTIFYGFNGMY